MDYANIATSATQSEPIPGREAEMIQNAASGYGFKITPLQQLTRFLILGTEGGTYYVSERDLTKQNYTAVKEAIKALGKVAVDEIVRVSNEGLAPKNKPALFALALCLSADDPMVRRFACLYTPQVARTLSDLYYLVSQATQLRGWGRVLKRAVKLWIESKTPEQLAYQALKYQNRYGWSLRDLLRVVHPKLSGEKDVVASYVVKGVVPQVTNGSTPASVPKGILSNELIKQGLPAKTVASMVVENRLPREIIPTELLNDPVIWKALLENMPMTALVRNLGKISSLGLTKGLSDTSKKIVFQLTDEGALKKARIHPFALFLARMVYEKRHGMKGHLSWTPDTQIIRALADAYDLAFKNVDNIKGRTLIAVDVSGSMTGERCSGSEFITCAEAAVGVSLALLKQCEQAIVVPFDTECHPAIALSLHVPSFELLERELNHFGGGTDCAAPIVEAAKWPQDAWPDTIVILTDNETWAGNTHAVKALEKMRKVKPVKCVIMPMSANNSSILDKDPLNFEIVGLDSSCIGLIADLVNTGF